MSIYYIPNTDTHYLLRISEHSVRDIHFSFNHKKAHNNICYAILWFPEGKQTEHEFQTYISTFNPPCRFVVHHYTIPKQSRFVLFKELFDFRGNSPGGGGKYFNNFDFNNYYPQRLFWAVKLKSNTQRARYLNKKIDLSKYILHQIPLLFLFFYYTL